MNCKQRADKENIAISLLDSKNNFITAKLIRPALRATLITSYFLLINSIRDCLIRC